MAGKKTTQREPQRPSGATSTTERSLVPAERIESAILILRGHRVILDEHLAALYEVEVKVLNQAVRRNLDRFPDDFMFQLSTDEAAFLRSQTVTLKAGRGRHRKYLPYAFTEQGVAMLSSVLRSKQAVAVNIEIMRAFVRIRKLIAGREDRILRLDALEARYDAQFSTVFDAIWALISDEARPRRRIGFQSGERKGSS